MRSCQLTTDAPNEIVCVCVCVCVCVRERERERERERKCVYMCVCEAKVCNVLTWKAHVSR